MSVDVGVHLYADTPVGHTAFPDASSGRPFVSVRLSGSDCTVALMVTDPAALTSLITVATVARAELEALTDRAATAA